MRSQGFLFTNESDCSVQLVNMLGSEVYLKHGHYRRIRRNALANILEGLNPEAVNWLSKNIAPESSFVEHPYEKYEINNIHCNDVEDVNNNRGDDDHESIAEKDGIYSTSEDEKLVMDLTKNEDISCSRDFEPINEDCLRRFSSSAESQFQSLAPIRRNALHDLLETLTAAEITTLSQLYQLEHSVKDLTLDPERFDQLITPTQYPYIETYFDKYLTQV
ncbi:hypothetical protein Ahia01_000557500 [Argonauta hians]